MPLEQYYQEDILKMIRNFDDNEVDAFLGLYQTVCYLRANKKRHSAV